MESVSFNVIRISLQKHGLLIYEVQYPVLLAFLIRLIRLHGFCFLQEIEIFNYSTSDINFI